MRVLFRSRPAILAVGLDRPEPGADGVERIDEIGPSGRRRAVGGKGAGLSFPSAIGRLRLLYLLRAHPFEIIVADIELPDMVETEKSPVAWPVEIRSPADRRAELARLGAAGMGAGLFAPFDAAVESALPLARTRHLTPLKTEERRVGKECGGTCRSSGAPVH